MAYWRYVEPQSSRSRQRIAQKGKPSGRGGCRDFPNPGRELSSLHLPLAAPCRLASSSALCANIARFFYALRRTG